MINMDKYAVRWHTCLFLFILTSVRKDCKLNLLEQPIKLKRKADKFYL